VGQANSSPSDTENDIEKLLYKADINMYYNKCKNHRLDIFTNNKKPLLPKEGFELLNVLAEKDMYTYVHSSTLLSTLLRLQKKPVFRMNRLNAFMPPDGSMT